MMTTSTLVGVSAERCEISDNKVLILSWTRLRFGGMDKHGSGNSSKCSDAKNDGQMDGIADGPTKRLIESFACDLKRR